MWERAVLFSYAGSVPIEPWEGRNVLWMYECHPYLLIFKPGFGLAVIISTPRWREGDVGDTVHGSLFLWWHAGILDSSSNLFQNALLCVQYNVWVSVVVFFFFCFWTLHCCKIRANEAGRLGDGLQNQTRRHTLLFTGDRTMHQHIRDRRCLQLTQLMLWPPENHGNGYPFLMKADSLWKKSAVMFHDLLGTGWLALSQTQ